MLDSNSDLEMDVVLDMGEPSELNLVDDEEDLNNNNANEENEEVDDNMFDFVLSSLDPDIEIEEEEDIGNDYCRAVWDGNDIDNMVDTLTTTNTGDLASTIEHETEYGGTFGNIKIAGSVFLNQCGTLLTQKKYQIKSSSRHNFVLQKMVATCRGKSIPCRYS